MGTSSTRRFLAVAAVAVAAAAPAAAHDPAAPPGAPHSWLPGDEWVLEHWLPYDETRLYRALGTDREGVRRWLRDDHTPLAELGRRNGIGVRVLTRRLVAPWRGRVSRARYRTLYRRARTTLTHAHLARHMFFHLYHQPTVHRASIRIFGVTPKELNRLRQREGLNRLEIGLRNGRTREGMVTATLRAMRASLDRAVRLRFVTRSQARRYLGYQRANIDGFLTSRARGQQVEFPERRTASLLCRP